jgi:hypothetical protein
MMRARSIVVLPALVTLGLVAGCAIDNRMLGLAADGAAGHGSGSGGAVSSHGSAGDGGSGGAAPEAILLGNFEDDIALPQDSRFGNYEYYSYNPSAPDLPVGAFVNSPLVPGYDSNFALGLNWEVIDVPDGVPNYPGVGVETLVKTGFVDLSGYNRIVFAQQYQHSGSCKAVQILTVSIGCGELNTSYQGTVAVSPTWTTSSLAFSTFVEPAPSGHSLAECLALADGVIFDAPANLADGDCASGSLALDNIEIRPGAIPSPDTGADGGASAGIAITPNALGYFDGTNAAGVVGAWWATGDDYDFGGMPRTGTCPMAGFPDSECSSIATPTPGKPFIPNPTGTGMCTSGIAAQVLAGDGGAPAYSVIWGNTIGFDLHDPPGFYTDAGSPAPDANITSKGQYDASAHGVTGIAFDIDTPPPGGTCRVEFQTMGTETNPAYWGGSTSNFSPVVAGHNEIRWSEVGGPFYLTDPPPFDPNKLEDVDLHVIANPVAPIPYSFCINNIVMLTSP